MACNYDKPPPKDYLEEETAKLMYKVSVMRKHFPKKCSEYRAKQLKMELRVLEDTHIALETTKEPDMPQEEMLDDESIDPMNQSELMNDFEELGKNMDNILAVLEQVKKEKSSNSIKAISGPISETSKGGADVNV